MGVHGALTIVLKNQEMFKSVSAFAPLSHPTACPLGIKLLTGYLGAAEENQLGSGWEQYDAYLLLSAAGNIKYDSILVDQGTEDEFQLDGTLMTDLLTEAAQKSGNASKLQLRMQEGYTHSYYFVSSFMEEHIKFHAERLRA